MGEDPDVSLPVLEASLVGFDLSEMNSGTQHYQVVTFRISSRFTPLAGRKSYPPIGLDCGGVEVTDLSATWLRDLFIATDYGFPGIDNLKPFSRLKSFGCFSI